MSAKFFKDQNDFRSWLDKNHKTKTELLVGFYKVKSGKASMTWPESVDQALCYGWIDGIRKSIDEQSYSIRFTPRRPTSIWSAVNVKKVANLKKAGLMQPEGEKAFRFLAENKSKIYSHEKKEAIDLDPAYETQFKKNKIAWNFFSEQAPSYKKVMIHWIMSAKREETRKSRLEKTIEASSNKKRMQ